MSLAPVHPPQPVGPMYPSVSGGASGGGSSGSGGSALAFTQVKRAAVQGISNNTWTIVSFDTEEFDSPNAYTSGSPTRITIPAGYTKARFKFHVGWASSDTGRRGSRLYKNGAVLSGTANMAKAQFESGHAGHSRWFTVTAGDYFELGVYQDTGANINLAGGDTQGEVTWLLAEFST